MRSRTEARFAAALDVAGIAWVYEPECFADETGQYLPDFLITYPSGRLLYVDVKPTNSSFTYGLTERMEIIWASLPEAQLMVVVPNTGACWIASPLQWEGWQDQSSCLWLDGEM